MSEKSEQERKADEERELAELREKYKVDPEVWARVVEEQKAKEREKRRRLFGDKEPFAIPDTDADV